MNYGIPYMGSKAKIIPSIAMLFPKADNFYDLFGGGFSVSHYMIKHRSNNYKNFYYNEIKKDIVEIVKSAINGDFNYNKFKPEWISRQDFLDRKDSDAYIRCIWSFGNNQEDYLFSKEIESYKKSMHMAIVFDKFDKTAIKIFGFKKWTDKVNTIKSRRLYLRQRIAWLNMNKKGRALLIDIKRGDMQQLEQLERLERLQQLERLTKLYITSKNYEAVKIKPNSVVYCDIPYNTENNYGKFERIKFLEWAASRNFPVYISEYNIDDERFSCVYTIDKISLFTSNSRIVKMEKLYWNNKGL